ncbi:MAG: hypothetical protein Q4C70_08260, partial [Planctomycetia bacterium]|nr:hypothetical protein [Planctomycetia bacterium]
MRKTTTIFVAVFSLAVMCGGAVQNVYSEEMTRECPVFPTPRTVRDTGKTWNVAPDKIQVILPEIRADYADNADDEAKTADKKTERTRAQVQYAGEMLTQTVKNR